MHTRVFVVFVVSFLAAVASAAAPGGKDTAATGGKGTDASGGKGTVASGGKGTDTSGGKGTAASPCTVGSETCCASVQNVRYPAVTAPIDEHRVCLTRAPFLQAQSQEVQKLLSQLNVKVTDPNTPIGVSCTDTTSCTAKAVCCKDNSYVRAFFFSSSFRSRAATAPLVLMCIPGSRTASSLSDAPLSIERGLFVFNSNRA